MNQVTNFMYYMFNKWSESEAKSIFGNDLGGHIWNKWLAAREKQQDNLVWYSELDRNCKQKLVERADQLYSK